MTDPLKQARDELEQIDGKNDLYRVDNALQHIDDAIDRRVVGDNAVEAYRAALQYGPEPFDNEPRAHYQESGEMMDFLTIANDSDLFEMKAYHKAGELGIDTCCVDWLRDVAEDTDSIHEFMDSLIEGYEPPEDSEDE